MKASVNKITEGAKLRDTLGRNRVTNLSNNDSIGMRLEVIQNKMSSDNVEKLTNIIITDKDTGFQWLLKYRILSIDGAIINGNDLLSLWIETLSHEQWIKLKSLIDKDKRNSVAVKEDEKYDSE